jgi:myosin-light-chain kinase
MAPEVFHKQYTHASQIWSVGVVIFALLTLRFPFDGIDKPLLRDQVESLYPVFYHKEKNRISKDLRSLVVDRLLHKNYLKRPDIRELYF